MGRIPLLLLLLIPISLLGQSPSTVATGDSRTVTEPAFPATCSTVAATKYIVQTTALNIDPFNATCGSTGGTLGTLGCTGGTSYEPSSTASPTFTSSETTDNTAVQAALNACTSGQAVELAPGAGGQRGFVMAPFTLPTGVGLIVDAGVHVFASRAVADYGGTNCGQITNGSSSCNHWITAASTTGSGIYGYGVLDGRGWDAYIGQTTQGFYANRIQAYCNARGGASHGSPACTPGTGNNSFGPNALDLVTANNFTMYKITVKDSGNFLVNWKDGNGFTAWGAKLFSPFEVSNTDGWDPLNSTNGTFTHGVISNGDNQMAIKATSGAASNITVSNTQTGAGIALAIGSATQFGVTNILVTDNVQNGNLFNDQSAGLQIGSSGSNGGLVNKVTFQNDCMMNENNSIRLYTNYGGGSGANTPIYQNILLGNITVLPSTLPYTTGNSGLFTFQGLSGNPILAQIDNLSIQGVNQGVASQNGVTTDQYASVYLGPSGPVPASIITQFGAGTSVTTAGTAGSGATYPCSTASWHPLVGELNVKTPTSNNNQSYINASTTNYTLQLVLQPATDISTKESPALTQPVQVLDNGVSLGNVAFTSDGIYAFLTISNPPAGVHVYNGYYPGDTNYPAFTFGGVTVVNPSPTVPASYWAMDMNTTGTAAPNISAAPTPSRPFGVLRLHDNGADLMDIFGNSATSTCNTSTHVYTTCSWTSFDHWVSLATTGNYVLEYTFHKTPNFAGTFTSSPPDDADFTAMVDAIRDRAGCTASVHTGCIAMWEVWNEPNNDGGTLSSTSSGTPYWSGSIEDLVHLARILHDEVKTVANGGVNGVDPNALILGPGVAGFGTYTNLPGGTVTMGGGCVHWGNGNAFPEAFICEYLRRTGSGAGDSTGKAYTDMVTTHSYPNGTGLTTMSEAGLVSHLGGIVTALGDNSITLCAHGTIGQGGGACTQLGSTEDGWGGVSSGTYPRIGPDATNSVQVSGTGLTGSFRDDQAAFIFKRYQLMWSLGLDMSVWYGWDFQNGWGNLLCSGANTNIGCDLASSGAGSYPYQNKAATAYGAMQAWMIGKTLTGTCSEDGNATWTCDWTGPYLYKGKSIWNSASTGVSTSISGFPQQRDLYGTVTTFSGTITPNWYPVILERPTTVSRSSSGWQ